MIDVIYLDMDGVIVDLERILGEIEGTPLDELRKTWNDPKFDLVIYLMRKHDEKKPFFHAPKMPKVEQIDQLIERAIKKGIRVEILSSGSKQEDLYHHVVSQKSDWLQRNGYAHLKTNFAKGGSTKKLWASPTALLIDDYKPNVDRFQEAGGLGILYDETFDLFGAIKELTGVEL